MIASRQLVRDYESLLRASFSDAIRCAVLSSTRCSDEESDEPVTEILCIPDGREGEFFDFMIDSLPDLALAHDLVEVELIPHNETDSRRLYGELCHRESGGARVTSEASPRGWASLACGRMLDPGRGRGALTRRTQVTPLPLDVAGTHYALAA